MIRRTKNSTIKTVIGCFALTAIFSLNGIGAHAVESNLNEVQSSAVQVVKDKNQVNNEFLIDEPIKYYYDITKVQKHAGFNFKLPSTLETSRWKGGFNVYQLVKLSDTSKAVVMDYEYNEEKVKKVDRYQSGMKLMIFRDDPLKTIEQIGNYNNSMALAGKYEFKENEKTYGRIKGKEVLVDEIIPHNDGGGAVIRTKYFIWQDDSVYYAINYDCVSLYAKDITDMQNLTVLRHNISIDENEVNKIVNSFKDIDSISEIDYKSTYEEDVNDIYSHPAISQIYDMDDLNESNEILGFKAKIPSEFTNKNVILQKSQIENVTDSSGGKKEYKLTLCYKNGIEEINFTQSMHDCYEGYSRAKDKGDLEITDQNNNPGKLKVESYNINGITIYKYIMNFASDNNYVYYLWKENGVYNQLEIRYALGYEDDIAKEFINYIA